MNFLILDGPRGPQLPDNLAYRAYRGTSRAHPTYCNEAPEHHEINQLFFWFIEEGGELGVVRDIRKAQRFAELWNERLEAPDRFEVVEATDGDCAPTSHGTFLGFDLSSGYNNSLLAWGLRYSPGIATLPEPIQELCGLLSRHYAPRLNAAGLFDTLEDATLCLGSMTALQDLSPNLFEGGNLRDFQPVCLYSIG
jgi:hypothetical protein